MIEQVVDKKSYGVLEYATQLDKEINLRKDLFGMVKDAKEKCYPDTFFAPDGYRDCGKIELRFSFADLTIPGARLVKS